ncbi:hypothetical protein AgCh_002686 [Apium graveolens]
MAGRESSSLLDRQKREILKMISDRPPEPKKRKLEDFEAPETAENNIQGVLVRKDGDLSSENRNKRMFKQLVGTLERVRKEDAEPLETKAHMRSLDSLKRIEHGIVEVGEVKDAAKEDSVGEETVEGVKVSHDDRSNTRPMGFGDRTPKIADSEAPSRLHVSKVLQKHEDESLLIRNKRMFRLLLGTLEADRVAEDQTMPKRWGVMKTREKEHEESERQWQISNEQIAGNDRDLSVSTRIAATTEEDLKVHPSKLRRIYRTKAEPSINYSFAKSLDADVPVEHQNLQGVAQVGSKTNFVHFEKIGGREINVLQGLELYTNVFGPDNQTDIVNCIYELQKKGRLGQLRGRTYSEPKKWMPGKGRITIQFGCCYNYAKDKNGNPPGVLRNEEVEPLPLLFKEMIKKMVGQRIIPQTCVPDSCIVNIYEVGDCIPPHIDHHDFLRPFCTVSFLTKCNILFGSNLEIIGAGKFKGPVSIPLPVGSVLAINGNGADIAKHCVPGVLDKRISITFRKMDSSKLPFNVLHDSE